jgi:predicted lipase
MGSFETVRFISIVRSEGLNIINLDKTSRYFSLLYTYKPTGAEMYLVDSPATFSTFGKAIYDLKQLDSIFVAPGTTNASIDALLLRIMISRGYRNTSANVQLYKNMYYTDYRNLLKSQISRSGLTIDSSKNAFWGSDRSLKFGRIVLDVLNPGLDDVFGAMLCPSGGIVGDGNNESTKSYNDSAILLHNLVKDASEHLILSFGLGNGYTYLSKDGLFKKNKFFGSPASDLVGIPYWVGLIKLSFKTINPLFTKPYSNSPFINYIGQLSILSRSIYSEHRSGLTFTNSVSFSVSSLNGFIGINLINNLYDIYITFNGIARVNNEKMNESFNELVKADAAGTKINNDYYFIYKNIRNVFITNFINILVSSSITNNLDVSNIKNIFIGGHKLGGVIASLCTFDINAFLPDAIINQIKSDNPNATTHLVLFDSPRVGDSNFADKIYQNINNLWRFNYANDLVYNVGNTSYVHPCKPEGISGDVFVSIDINADMKQYTSNSSDTRKSSTIAYTRAFSVRDPKTLVPYQTFLNNVYIGRANDISELGTFSNLIRYISSISSITFGDGNGLLTIPSSITDSYKNSSETRIKKLFDLCPLIIELVYEYNNRIRKSILQTFNPNTVFLDQSFTIVNYGHYEKGILYVIVKYTKSTTENEYFVIFRGSTSLPDVLADLNVFKLGTPNPSWMVSNNNTINAQFHDGIDGIFIELCNISATNQQVLTEALNTIINDTKTKKIAIAGHSLGGGIASYTTAYILEKIKTTTNKIRVDMLLFASMKFGNEGANRYLSSLLVANNARLDAPDINPKNAFYSFRIQDDIVPMLAIDMSFSTPLAVRNNISKYEFPGAYIENTPLRDINLANTSVNSSNTRCVNLYITSDNTPNIGLYILNIITRSNLLTLYSNTRTALTNTLLNHSTDRFVPRNIPEKLGSIPFTVSDPLKISRYNEFVSKLDSLNSLLT